ncbi:MAG: DUF6580 family putative transport protein [Balneolaceae bacterium]
MKKNAFLIITGFILFAALTRLLPHAYNFTPLGAIALFGAAYFSQKRWAFIVPIVALWLSDLFLNNMVYAEYYDGFALFTSGFLYIYGAFALIAILGIKLFDKVTLPRVIGGALGGSVIFFIVSNFGVWITSPMYPLTAEGLLMCYTAAIPFFHYTIAGNLVYCGVLFGGYEYLKYKMPEQLAVNA